MGSITVFKTEPPSAESEMERRCRLAFGGKVRFGLDFDDAKRSLRINPG